MSSLLFVDTWFWVATLNPRDAWHDFARGEAQRRFDDRLVTSEEVLSEVLAYFAEGGAFLREVATTAVRGMFRSPLIEVERQSHASFLAGLELYEQRLDKGYSLVDCVSMVTMRRLGITEVLTGDRHFAQEGFITLF